MRSAYNSRSLVDTGLQHARNSKIDYLKPPFLVYHYVCGYPTSLR